MSAQPVPEVLPAHEQGNIRLCLHGKTADIQDVGGDGT